MPRLRDFPIAVHRIGKWDFLKRIYLQIYEDNLLVWAAAMAYSWLFAIFPFLIFLLTLVPLLPFNKEQVTLQMVEFVNQSLPEDAAQTVNANVYQVLNQPQPGLMSTGIILAIWAASGGMAMTMAAMNKCYKVKETRPFYVSRPLAILLTLITAALVLAVLVLLPVGTAVRAAVDAYLAQRERYLPGVFWLAVDLARWSLALLLMIIAVALVYHFGTKVRKRFHWITPGSVFTILMWILLGLVVRFYIDRFGGATYHRTYGAVGGAAILLLVFYLDSLVLLIGAEINAEADYALISVPVRPEESRPESDIPIEEVQKPETPPAPSAPGPEADKPTG